MLPNCNGNPSNSNGRLMAYNVFLSFVTEDQGLVELFRGQARDERLGLTFRDYSIKESFDSAWKTNCERVMRICSATICLIGRTTYRSDAVDWEIRKSHELGKGIMAVFLDSGALTIPRALQELGVRPVAWQMDKITQELLDVVR